MLKLPFRYALSAGYAQLIIEDVIAAAQGLAYGGWYSLLVFLDPAVQFYHQHRARQIHQDQAQKMVSQIQKKIGFDEEAEKIVKEVCVDFELGEIKVIMWNRMNAGYVFRRIYLPAEWREFLDPEELKAIVGHELGHQKLGSDAMIPLRLVNRMGDELLFSMLPVHLTGYFLLIMSFVAENPSYLKLLSLTFLFRMFHMLVENGFTRKDEFKADQYGIQASAPETMKSALKKMDLRARLEIYQNLHHLHEIKQVYYRWLLKKEHGALREALLDHPFLQKRIEAMKV